MQKIKKLVQFDIVIFQQYFFIRKKKAVARHYKSFTIVSDLQLLKALCLMSE